MAISFRRVKHLTWAVPTSIMVVVLAGCVQKPHGDQQPRIITFADHSGSTFYLRAEIIRVTTQVAVSAPPKTVVEASTFGSQIKIAPFYTGIVRNPAAFHGAITTALTAPTPGQGTFGAPLLKRVRQRVHGSTQPTFVVIASDCGFNDLPEMHSEAVLLAKEPALIAVYALPAISNNDPYTQLESALRPLGSRLRVAAAADAPEAIQELQQKLRACPRIKGTR